MQCAVHDFEWMDDFDVLVRRFSWGHVPELSSFFRCFCCVSCAYVESEMTQVQPASVCFCSVSCSYVESEMTQVQPASVCFCSVLCAYVESEMSQVQPASVCFCSVSCSYVESEMTQVQPASVCFCSVLCAYVESEMNQCACLLPTAVVWPEGRATTKDQHVVVAVQLTQCSLWRWQRDYNCTSVRRASTTASEWLGQYQLYTQDCLFVEENVLE